VKNALFLEVASNQPVRKYPLRDHFLVSNAKLIYAPPPEGYLDADATEGLNPTNWNRSGTRKGEKGLDCSGDRWMGLFLMNTFLLTLCVSKEMTS